MCIMVRVRLWLGLGLVRCYANGKFRVRVGISVRAMI